jgi:hypothetical protein
LEKASFYWQVSTLGTRHSRELGELRFYVDSAAWPPIADQRSFEILLDLESQLRAL